MKFYIETFGCKVNSYESNYVKQSLLDNGFLYVPNIKKANIIIINTCTVTNTADKKCQKFIRRARRENKDSILVVMGCSSQNHFQDYLNMQIDILLGNKEKTKLPVILKEYLNNKIPYSFIVQTRNLEFEDMSISDFDHTRAFIKIQDGCDNFCTYCIIPFVRGQNRSKKFANIISEAKNLALNGHQEIVLTGIHTGAYADKGKDLVDVINAISEIEEIKRIRLSSVEITELNAKFMNMLKINHKFCDHLHIPLQAGSDEILTLMNRKYDLKYYQNKIFEIRKIRPLISITTDIIVGFPTESDEMFLSTYEFAKKIEFSKIHVFPYSKRIGTKASLMNEVDENIKKERVQKLLQLSNELENKYENKFKGKVVSVLIEEVKDGKSIGHTSNYLKVIVPKVLEKNKFYDIIYK